MLPYLLLALLAAPSVAIAGPATLDDHALAQDRAEDDGYAGDLDDDLEESVTPDPRLTSLNPIDVSPPAEARELTAEERAAWQDQQKALEANITELKAAAKDAKGRTNISRQNLRAARSDLKAQRLNVRAAKQAVRAAKAADDGDAQREAAREREASQDAFSASKRRLRVAKHAMSWARDYQSHLGELRGVEEAKLREVKAVLEQPYDEQGVAKAEARRAKAELKEARARMKLNRTTEQLERAKAR